MTPQNHLAALVSKNRSYFDGQFNLDISAETLERTFLEDLSTQVNSPDFITLEKPDGMLVGHKMAWDTQYFGYPVFKLDHLFTAHPETGAALVKELMDKLKREGYRYVFARTKAQDTIFQNALTGSGFNLMLHKVMLRYDLGKNGSILNQKTNPDLEIRPFDLKDEEFVAGLAATALMTSRFSLDPKIEPELTAGIYRNWAKELIRKTPESIRIAEYQGKPAGMVATSEANTLYGGNKFAEYPMGFISLVAVEDAFRGKSVGQALIRSAIADYEDRKYQAVFANTALQNLGSTIMFQKAGFDFFSMVSEYRCWL
jgi:ribosomal protein S18 acetylase RimI-like enzyme